MVIINGVKFACEKCIKGHRATTCQHTDRPQLEIRKKGRPITQCAHCRELRKTKKLHIKCICAERAQSGADAHPSCGPPPKRSSGGSMKVKDLLNPCDCSKSSHCQCCELICDTPTTRFCRPKKGQSLNVSISDTAPILIQTEKDIQLAQQTSNGNTSSSNLQPNVISPTGSLPTTISSCCIPTELAFQSAITQPNLSEKAGCCSQTKDLDGPNKPGKFLKTDDNNKVGNFSFCSCGCRTKPSLSNGSRLSLDDLLNPCNCCQNGRVCICCRLPTTLDSPNSSKPFGGCCGDSPVIQNGSSDSEQGVSSGLAKEFAQLSHDPSDLKQSEYPINNAAQIGHQAIKPISAQGNCCGTQPKSQFNQSQKPTFPPELDPYEELYKKVETKKLEGGCCKPSSTQPTDTLNGLYENFESTSTSGGCCKPSITAISDMNTKKPEVETCSSCRISCKCSSGGGCCPTLNGPKTEYVDQDGVRTCGCGCYLAKVQCSDCVKDDCTEFLLRP